MFLLPGKDINNSVFGGAPLLQFASKSLGCGCTHSLMGFFTPAPSTAIVLQTRKAGLVLPKCD